MALLFMPAALQISGPKPARRLRVLLEEEEIQPA
jgi:hypothetical protein